MDRIEFLIKTILPFKQLSTTQFFKWALENDVIKYIEDNYEAIESDMNTRNSTSRRNNEATNAAKTRKKREELSISAERASKRKMLK